MPLYWLTPGGFFPGWPFAGNGETFRYFSGSLARKIWSKVSPRKSRRDLVYQKSRQDCGFSYRREIIFAAFVKTWRDLTRPVKTNYLARLLPSRRDFSEFDGTFWCLARLFGFWRETHTFKKKFRAEKSDRFGHVKRTTRRDASQVVTSLNSSKRMTQKIGVPLRKGLWCLGRAWKWRKRSWKGLDLRIDVAMQSTRFN